MSSQMVEESSQQGLLSLRTKQTDSHFVYTIQLLKRMFVSILHLLEAQQLSNRSSKSYATFRRRQMRDYRPITYVRVDLYHSHNNYTFQLMLRQFYMTKQISYVYTGRIDYSETQQPQLKFGVVTFKMTVHRERYGLLTTNGNFVTEEVKLIQ